MMENDRPFYLELMEFYNGLVARAGRHYITIVEDKKDLAGIKGLEMDRNSFMSWFLDRFTEKQLRIVDPRGEILKKLGDRYFADVQQYVNAYLEIFRS